MRRALLLLLLLLAGHPLHAQLPSAADWHEDVAVLRDALETVHPGLHRYQRAFDYDALERELAASRDLGEAWVTLARFLSTIECGHTFPNPANQKRVVAEAVFRNTPRVPFYFRWAEGRMIVTRDASQSGAFPAGTEIVAINGMPVTKILERLLPLSRTDGANDAKRVANLEVLPEERWSAFDVYYPLLFHPPSGAWTFALRDRTVEEAPVTDAARLALRDELLRTSKESNAPPWTLEIRGTTAVLAMKTWVTFNDHWDWEGFLRRAFETMEARRVKRLVIDLRRNEGGSSVGDVILAHLITKPVPRDLFGRYVRYRELPERLRPVLDTWDRSFDRWADAEPAAAKPGFFRLPSEKDEIAPRKPHFGGRVDVLVGPENSSATFEFALAMRRHRLGKLIGRPTGGNQRGINGGAFYFLRLPHSLLEVDLPIIGYFAEGKEPPNGGIAPDVLVRHVTDPFNASAK